jgi:uncharacterized protein
MNIILIATFLPNFLKRNIRKFHFPKQSQSIALINFDRLIDSGIQGIIIDLDNTIISEDDRYVSPNAITWISKAKNLGFKLFILSNGKRHYRVKLIGKYVQTTYPVESELWEFQSLNYFKNN